MLFMFLLFCFGWLGFGSFPFSEIIEHQLTSKTPKSERREVAEFSKEIGDTTIGF